MKRSSIVTVLVFAAIAGVYVFRAQIMHRIARAILSASVPAPMKTPRSFTLPDSEGHTVRLADFRGKVVLLNFWATWCGPCKVEIPWFEEFQQKYGARGFTVIGVSMDEDGWKVVKPFMDENKMNYPVVVANTGVNLMYGGIESLPTTLMIRRDGKTVAVHSGLMKKEEYEQEIIDLLDAR